ncbi:hypothetical protein WJX77_008928 [Trebouxia sp. C0004]
MKSLRSQRSLASLFASVVATIVVGGLCTSVIVGNLQPGAGSLRQPSGRHLLQEDSSPAARAHRNKLHHVHGWLMCLSWGFLIPLGVVIACFRTVRVGVYLDPGQGGLFWQHKIIGVTVNVLALVQVLAGILIKPPNTSNLRRVWNAVVLGGLFIIVMLKNDIEYLLVGCTPAEEEAKLKAAGVIGSQRDLGQTNFPALAIANGKGKPSNGKGKPANGKCKPAIGKGRNVKQRSQMQATLSK